MALKDEETLNRRETQQKRRTNSNNNGEGETAHTENDLSEMD